MSDILLSSSSSKLNITGKGNRKAKETARKNDDQIEENRIIHGQTASKSTDDDWENEI